MVCVQKDNVFECANRFFPSKHEINPLFGQTAIDVGIRHKLIFPYTLRHNGKAERSHRNSRERVYNHPCFYSCIDFHLQMKKLSTFQTKFHGGFWLEISYSAGNV